eukprot:1177589-Prorocentrum_minimum.AAC.2
MPPYAELEYWETRYGASGTALFDWYVGFEGVKPFLDMVPVKAASNIIILGCGNSPVGEKIYDEGFRKVTSIDFCESVVSFMKSRSAVNRPELKYLTMDALQLPFPDEYFDIVIDKGTLDCVLTVRKPLERVHRLCERVSQVLVPGGVFIVYSFGNPGDREHLFKKVEYGWNVKTYCIPKPSLTELGAGNEEDFIPRQIKKWELEGLDEDTVHFVYVMRKRSPHESTEGQENEEDQEGQEGQEDQED